MSDTTTTPIATFNPMNRFVTFDGLKDYDANLISNLHSLGYNNKVSGANIFAWGNNNQIDGQNLFVFGNEFNLTSIAKRPSMFIGNGSIISESGWNDTENTIFGVWHEYSPAPIFRVGAEETPLYEGWLSAAFSIGRDGSFYAANGKFIVNTDGSFSAADKKFNVGSDGSFHAAGKNFIVDKDGAFSAANGAFIVGSDGSFSIDNSRFQINDNSFIIKYSGGLVAARSLTPFYIYDNNQNTVAFEISWNGTITKLNHKVVQWLPIEIKGTTYYCLGLTQKPS